MPIFLIVIISVLFLVLLWLIYQLLWGTPPWINLAVERLAFKMISSDPETLTTLGLLDNTLLDFHSHKLTDASPGYMEMLRQLDREGLALIRQYDQQMLKGQPQITYLVMQWYFEQNLRGHRFDYHWVANPVFMGPYPVNHVFGVQIDLINFLCTYHKIEGRRSLRNYLTRLKRIPWKLDGLQVSIKAREDAGIIPPRFVVEKSLRQIGDFLAKDDTENPLYASFMEKLTKNGKFSKTVMDRWGKKVRHVVHTTVRPAYLEFQKYLQALLEESHNDDGVWHLPDGEAYYAFLLRMHTTTDLTAKEIHELGLEHVAELTSAIQSILEELGLPVEEPGKQLKVMMQDPKYHYQGEDQRGKILRDYQNILDEANQRMPEVFTPGSMEKIVVKRLPEFREPDSPIAYAEAPAMDGSRPGTMWLNLRDPDNVYKWGMRTLAYHEGIPGHVYQMAQAQKIKGLPTFRRTYFFNAYVEGWALYAERLGWELGLEDAFSNLGRLQALIWRAARLVVDTGIHAMRWTREEAIDYMLKVTGLPERDVITEVERYIVMPGQACAYYIGYLKLLSLREKAEAILGDAFDLKSFHEEVIKNGGLPLVLLEKVVNDYIDQVSGLKPI
jgi:uncharacterized protein (DUF885 family)